jgi:hypothetical protein
MSKQSKPFSDPVDAGHARPDPPHTGPGTGNALGPGKPGYRNRLGRTGLDPIEASLESASLEGLFLKRVFTGRLRTRRKVYLWLMGLLGLLLLLPWALVLASGGNLSEIASLAACFSPFGILGIGLLVNLGLNLKRN